MRADIIPEYVVDERVNIFWNNYSNSSLQWPIFLNHPPLIRSLFSFLPDFYNFLLVGAAVLTQTRLHFFVIGPHGM